MQKKDTTQPPTHQGGPHLGCGSDHPPEMRTSGWGVVMTTHPATPEREAIEVDFTRSVASGLAGDSKKSPAVSGSALGASNRAIPVGFWFFGWAGGWSRAQWEVRPEN